MEDFRNSRVETGDLKPHLPGPSSPFVEELCSRYNRPTRGPTEVYRMFPVLNIRTGQEVQVVYLYRTSTRDREEIRPTDWNPSGGVNWETGRVQPPHTRDS